MDITAAIEQLTKFKKMSKGLGDCDLVAFDNDSLTLRVRLGSRSVSSTGSIRQDTYKPVLGFSQDTIE